MYSQTSFAEGATLHWIGPVKGKPCTTISAWYVFPRLADLGEMLITAGEYEGLVDSIQRTTAGIAEEVKDATVFIFPGGVHEDFIGAFASGEGGTGDDYCTCSSLASCCQLA
jgi:hypothetical protein